jgi:hypothetical protein
MGWEQAVIVTQKQAPFPSLRIKKGRLDALSLQQ